jgi:hypothetical protein
MSAIGGPNIVEDGLVLALDAGNTKSYPGSGTTWSDLSGNGNNGTLTNGPTFDSANLGSISFDGVNDYVSMGFQSGLFAQSTDQVEISVDVFVYFNATSIFQPIWQIGGYINSAVIGVTDTNKARFIVRKDTAGIDVPKVDSSTTITTGQWYHFAASKTNTTMTLYINGVSEDSISTSYTWNTGGNTPNWIAQTNGQSGLSGTSVTHTMNGKVSSLKIYDRGLTPSEVLQNYNATKGRFGL